MQRIGSYLYNSRVFSKVKDYTITVAKDYKVSLLDSIDLVKRRPIFTSISVSLLTALYYTRKACPSESDYLNALKSSVCDLWETPRVLQSPKTSEFLEKRLRLFQEDRIRTVDLFIVRLIWWDHGSKNCKLYREISPQFHSSGAKDGLGGFIRLFLYEGTSYKYIWRERVLDVGAFGKWFWLDTAMLDYDVNERDWENQSMLQLQ
ncbi:hypothetical protein Ciccas_012977 [Cichlidogyrus casuarinus]|uniref:Uncharacterized protein n=1 Tax=Cichlidogyrus casuarinus TaxID=1844966 RepID=A0ABD2PLU9_9PLAT